MQWTVIQKTETPTGAYKGSAYRLHLTLQYPEIPDCPRVTAFFSRLIEAYRDGIFRRLRISEENRIGTPADRKSDTGHRKRKRCRQPSESREESSQKSLDDPLGADSRVPETVIRLTCSAGELDSSVPAVQTVLWEAVEYDGNAGSHAAAVRTFRQFAVRFNATNDLILIPTRFPLSRKTEALSDGRLCALQNTFSRESAGSLRYSQLRDTVKLLPVLPKKKKTACNSEEKMVH